MYIRGRIKVEYNSPKIIPPIRATAIGCLYSKPSLFKNIRGKSPIKDVMLVISMGLSLIFAASRIPTLFAKLSITIPLFTTTPKDIKIPRRETMESVTLKT